MTKRVIIIGGGVAGLSAAHELCERGFEVAIYERWDIPGGKARSTWVPQPKTLPAAQMEPMLGLGRKASDDPQHGNDLPGEHGFRFIPGFYRHLPATLGRIPHRRTGKTVLDNLVSAERVMTTSHGTEPISYPQVLPRSPSDLLTLFNAMDKSSLGLSDTEKRHLLRRVWQVATSCDERRLAEYEKLSWWQFLNADDFSPTYQRVVDLPRLTVAADPRSAESRTMGNMALQMTNLNFSTPKDRVFNDPTNVAWIDPWVDHLRSQGAELHVNAKATAVQCVQGRIQSVTIQQGEQEHIVSGDYYLFCVPVEAMADLLAQDMSNSPEQPYTNVLAADPSLANVIELSKSVSWMNGIQFYLNVDVPITHGHVMFLDTPWALTGISQRQFWPQCELEKCYNGQVKGILSVDISEWTVPGMYHKKPARECSIQEIAEETWYQMLWSLNPSAPKPKILSDDMIVAYHVDTDIACSTVPNAQSTNAEPLLVNQPNTWRLRPDATTLIANMFLAADYVRTNTMLATMEAANEAARRAVNAILTVEGRSDYCKIWQLHEPVVLAPWRLYDRWRYGRGLAWNSSPPLIVSATARALFFLHTVWRKITHQTVVESGAPAAAALPATSAVSAAPQ